MAGSYLTDSLACATDCLAGLPGYEQAVIVRTVVWDGGAPGLGVPVVTDVELLPRPRMTTTSPRYTGGPAGKTADGVRLIDRVGPAYTRADLEDRGLAKDTERYYLVGDLPYRIESEPIKAFLGWTYSLRRMESRRHALVQAAIVPPPVVQPTPNTVTTAAGDDVQTIAGDPVAHLP